MATATVRNLDDMVRSPGSVILFGNEHAVSSVDGDTLKLVRQMGEGSGHDAIQTMYEVAARLLPTVENVGRLIPSQIEAVIQIATSPVAKVEEAMADPKVPAATESGAPPAGTSA